MVSLIQRRKALTQVLVLLFVMLASLVAFGQSPSPSAASHPTVSLVPGGAAPDFTLPSVNGETVSLSDLRGQTILIYFWATWVGPCKIMTPWLVDLQNKYGARGFHVLAVSLDDDITRVELGEFADQNHMNFPVLVGNEKIAGLYGGVPGMPEIFLIDSDGKVSEIIVGIRDKSEIERSIKKTLNKRPDVTSNSPAQK